MAQNVGSVAKYKRGVKFINADQPTERNRVKNFSSREDMYPCTFSESSRVGSSTYLK